MSKKQPPPIRNWSEYNQSLVKRGSVTIWFDEESIKEWNSSTATGREGRPQLYSDIAIQCALMVRSVYHLSLRATQGFLLSIAETMSLAIPIPHFDTISRRAKTLKVTLDRAKKPGEPLHLIVDSAGVKVYGEGEWKTRKHGYSKRRTWRKLHLGICAETQQVVVAAFTTNDVSDDDALLPMLDHALDPVAKVSGDGACDKRKCYEAMHRKGATPVIPPRRNGTVQSRTQQSEALRSRDQALRRIQEFENLDEGRKAWEEEIGYHRRSLVETAMYRFKTLTGATLRARCSIINRMAQLGMPNREAA